MRMAELSRTTGVPVPTIKYYLREGLLPAGRRTSPNQADYDAAHARRLRVIRSLVEVAQLPISTIGELLHEIDSPEPALHSAFGLAQASVTKRLAAGDHPHRARAADMLEDLLTRRGWLVHPDNPARAAAIAVLATYLALDADDLAASTDRYAEAAEIVAEADVGTIAARTDTEHQVEGVVIGTLLGDTLLTALRRLAQENVSARIFAGAALSDAGGAVPGDASGDQSAVSSVDAERLAGGGDQ
ncbi:MAG: MerR family transcriptional regulator [Micromonosporaceae bacterium]